MNVAKDGLADVGNWREIQTVDEHGVIYVQEKEKMPPRVRGLMIGLILVSVVAFIAIIFCAVFGMKLSSRGSNTSQVGNNSQVEMK